MTVESSPAKIQSHFVIRDGKFVVSKNLVRSQEEIDFSRFSSWATEIRKRMGDVLFGGMELQHNFFGVLNAHFSCPQIKNRRLLEMICNKFFQEDLYDWEIKEDIQRLKRLKNLISPQLIRHVFELTEGIIEDVLELEASPQSSVLLINDSNLPWLFEAQLACSGIFVRTQLEALTGAQKEAIGEIVLPKDFRFPETPRLSSLLARSL